METQLPGKKSIIIGLNAIKECEKLCPETIALRQYLDKISALNYIDGKYSQAVSCSLEHLTVVPATWPDHERLVRQREFGAPPPPDYL